jgi:lysozyme family protein
MGLIKEDVLRDLGRLWGAAEIRPERLVEITGVEQAIAAGRTRYEIVAAEIGCPWWLIGIVHGLECSWSFTKHLHNGDPLGAPTSRVPAGRPLGWMDLPQSDRTWERSAVDACRRLGWDQVKAWTIPEALYRLEAYNGFGYRLYHPGIPTPYLWAATTLYGPPNGKYIEEKRDGKWVSVWKPDLVSRQVGSAAVLKRLLARGMAFPDVAAVVNPPAPAERPNDLEAIRVYKRGENVLLAPNFHLREFSCHCGKCSSVLVSPTQVARLQQLRNALKKPITITSGYRCEKHNAAVGGVADSQHPRGTATNIKVAGLTPAQVAVEAEKIWTDGGLGIYRTFVHLDSRGSRARWRG